MPSRTTASKEREWCGPAAQTLQRIYNCESPEPLFIEKAREIVQKSGIIGPPFDPYLYAKFLGITVIEKETMVLDGTVTQNENGKFVVHLKKFPDPLTRKNFTLAHEIAHTFFYNDLVRSQSHRGHTIFDKEEEKLCNKAAAELLMPYSQFKASLFKDGCIDPKTLLRLADEYQVSLSAVLTRVWEVTNNVSCSLWRQDGYAINLEWIAPKEMKGLILCQTGKSSIETAISSLDEVSTKRDSYYCLQPAGSRMIKRTTSSCRLLASGLVLSVIMLKKSYPITKLYCRKATDFLPENRY